MKATEHELRVDDWMASIVTCSQASDLVDAFERAFGALWERAHVTLGEITLTAIVDRVLYSASETYPAFALVKVNATGLDCAALRARVDDTTREELARGIRFVLFELLTVIGSLTAEILSPALHAELTAATRSEETRGSEEPTPDSADPES
jgi:hypothetical protein